MVLDFDAGEFHCPQCKAVGNLMVPVTPTPGEGAGTEFHKTSEAGNQGSVVVARGGGARRRFVKDGDDMDVSEDEWQVGVQLTLVLASLLLLIADSGWLIFRRRARGGVKATQRRNQQCK